MAHRRCLPRSEPLPRGIRRRSAAGAAARRLRLSVLVPLLGALGACAAGAGPAARPTAPATGQTGSGLVSDPTAAPSLPPEALPGPLRVVFAAPEGQTTGPSEISLVFSKPMRPLGLGPYEPRPPATMRPEATGRWRWVGSRALRFDADAELQRATAFRVEVPAGTRALDGTALAAPFVLWFSTPRPTLRDIEPRADEQSVAPDAAVTLWLSDPVAAAEIGRAVSLLARPVGAGRATGAPPTRLPFTVLELDHERVKLAPVSPWPRSAEITVRLDASLRSQAGALPLGTAVERRFRTIEPFRVARWDCAPHPTEAGACLLEEGEGGSVTLALGTMVAAKDVTQSLSVTPTVPDLAIQAVGYGDTDNTFRVTGGFEPGRSYALRLRARVGGKPLEDVWGQRLVADATRVVRFGQLAPAITIGAGGTYWIAGGRMLLPVGVLNVRDARIDARPLTLHEVLAELGGAERAGVDPPRPLALAPGKRNESTWSRVALSELLPTADTSGPIRVRASYRDPSARQRQSVTKDLQVTDLGLVTEAGRDRVVSWVTSLRTGVPIGDAKLELYGVGKGTAAPAAPLATATTAPDGLGSLGLGSPLGGGSGAGPSELAIVVRSGKDWAYQILHAALAAKPVGLLFDERGIYRPGEKVELEGVVRTPALGGLETPRGREIRLELRDPSDKAMGSWTERLSAFGTFVHTVELPADAPLGRYTVHGKIDDAELWDGFLVADYRPAETKVEAKVDRDELVRGDMLRCAARGEYLYGASMAGATASIVVSRSSGGYSIPELEGWETEDADAAGPAEAEVAHATLKLDAGGSVALPVTLTLPGQGRTESVTCSVEIADLNRQVRSAAAGATVHPGEVYVALERPKSYDIEPGQALTQRVLVVTPKGERRSLPVHLDLALRNQGYGTPAPESPVGSCEVTSGPSPVSCAFTVPRSARGGQQELAIRGATTDARGNRVTAAYTLAIAEPPSATPPPAPPPPEPSIPSPPAPPRLRVEASGAHPDSHLFHLGDRARVQIESPYAEPARALVTVAREGLLLERVVDLPAHGQGSATLYLPVSAAMIPNAEVTVVAIHAEHSEKTSLSLEVDPAPRQLAVDLRICPARAAHAEAASGARDGCRPGAALAPGSEVQVAASVTDADHHPARAEVTLWAADEGSLALTYYRTPDPMGTLFSYRPVRLELGDARDDLVRLFTGRHVTRAPQVRMGATSVGDRRGDFRQTVFFAPRLVTDAAGRVVQRVKLPDGLTTYRFMAVAVAEDDRFGAATEELVTRKSLMVRPTLPRVVRVGDELEASVVVSSAELPASKVTLEVRAEGMSVVGPRTRTVSLEPERPAEARFTLRAVREGRAELSFDASVRDDEGVLTASDGVALSPEVLAVGAPEVAMIHGETRGAVREKLGDLSRMRSDSGGLSISLSASPLWSLAEGIEQLLDYPYGCTEQTVSRMVPLLALRDLLGPLGIPVSDLPRGGSHAGRGSDDGAAGSGAARGLDAVLAEAVARVLANQRPDGGFGLWPESGDSDPWITSYALWGLGEAKRRGQPVPPDALGRGFRYLDARLGTAAGASREAAPDDARALDLATSAFELDVLAAEGRRDEARAAKLYAARDELPTFAKALLLHALATTAQAPGTAGPPAGAAAELVRELETTVRIDGPFARVADRPSGTWLGPLLDSSVRTSAMALRALLAVDAHHVLAGPLASGLLADRSGGRWRTTQEAAWALLALDAYRRAQPVPAARFDARAFLGPQPVAETSFGATALARHELVRLPMARLQASSGAPLTFAVQGSGQLYYEAKLSFVRRELPTDAIDAGLFVDKTIRPIASLGSEPGIAHGGNDLELRAGQVVLCQIDLVTASPRQFVAIEDPLPGGLEPVDFELGTGSGWLQRFEQGLRPTWGRASRRELHDDKVVFFVDALPAGISTYRYLARATTIGRFVAPPTRAEEMYAPETFGRTAGRFLRVVPP